MKGRQQRAAADRARVRYGGENCSKRRVSVRHNNGRGERRGRWERKAHRKVAQGSICAAGIPVLDRAVVRDEEEREAPHVQADERAGADSATEDKHGGVEGVQGAR